MVNEPKADDYGEGTYVEDPNDIVREDSAR